MTIHRIATAASVYHVGAVYSAGINYVVGDILTAVGGVFTFPLQVQVTSVAVGGDIDGMSIFQHGNYTTPPTVPIATTGGTGTGCELDATFSPLEPLSACLPCCCPGPAHPLCSLCDAQDFLERAWQVVVPYIIATVYGIDPDTYTTYSIGVATFDLYWAADCLWRSCSGDYFAPFPEIVLTGGPGAWTLTYTNATGVVFTGTDTTVDMHPTTTLTFKVTLIDPDGKHYKEVATAAQTCKQCPPQGCPPIFDFCQCCLTDPFDRCCWHIDVNAADHGKEDEEEAWTDCCDHALANPPPHFCCGIVNYPEQDWCIRVDVPLIGTWYQSFKTGVSTGGPGPGPTIDAYIQYLAATVDLGFATYKTGNCYQCVGGFVGSEVDFAICEQNWGFSWGAGPGCDGDSCVSTSPTLVSNHGLSWIFPSSGGIVPYTRVFPSDSLIMPLEPVCCREFSSFQPWHDSGPCDSRIEQATLTVTPGTCAGTSSVYVLDACLETMCHNLKLMCTFTHYGARLGGGDIVYEFPLYAQGENWSSPYLSWTVYTGFVEVRVRGASDGSDCHSCTAVVTDDGITTTGAPGDCGGLPADYALMYRAIVWYVRSYDIITKQVKERLLIPPVFGANNCGRDSTNTYACDFAGNFQDNCGVNPEHDIGCTISANPCDEILFDSDVFTMLWDGSCTDCLPCDDCMGCVSPGGCDPSPPTCAPWIVCRNSANSFRVVISS